MIFVVEVHTAFENNILFILSITWFIGYSKHANGKKKLSDRKVKNWSEKLAYPIYLMRVGYRDIALYSNAIANIQM